MMMVTLHTAHLFVLHLLPLGVATINILIIRVATISILIIRVATINILIILPLLCVTRLFPCCWLLHSVTVRYSLIKRLTWHL